MRPIPLSNWLAQGWWLPARALPSPNFNQRPTGSVVDLLVLHSISLPPGEFGNGCVQQLFSNTLDCQAHPYFERLDGLRVSSHFFISRLGVVWQFVGCAQRAWHAGESSYRGLANCNDHSIGIELEGLEGWNFQTAQYTALATLCSALLGAYPITHIAGHQHIAPLRKQDPGSGFDWPQLKSMLAHHDLAFPPEVLLSGAYTEKQNK